MLDMSIRWKKRPTFHSHRAEKGHLLQDGCILSWFHSRSSTTASWMITCDLYFYFWRMTYEFVPRSSLKLIMNSRIYKHTIWILKHNMCCKQNLRPRANKVPKAETDIIDIWVLTTYFTQLWENFSSCLCLTVEKGAVVFWSGLGFSQLWLYE